MIPSESVLGMNTGPEVGQVRIVRKWSFTMDYLRSSMELPPLCMYMLVR